MENAEASRVRSVETVIMESLDSIQANARKLSGDERRRYIDEVGSQRDGYHETIRLLCQGRGILPGPIIAKFDSYLDYIRKEVGSEPELIDLTSDSPLPPELDFSTQRRQY